MTQPCSVSSQAKFTSVCDCYPLSHFHVFYFCNLSRGLLFAFPSEWHRVWQEGNPGYVSEKSGKPANLFHVVFDDNPGHPYAQYLLHETDLDEYEIVDNLLPPEVPAASGSPSKKKRRR